MCPAEFIWQLYSAWMAVAAHHRLSHSIAVDVSPDNKWRAFIDYSLISFTLTVWMVDWKRKLNVLCLCLCSINRYCFLRGWVRTVHMAITTVQTNVNRRTLEWVRVGMWRLPVNFLFHFIFFALLWRSNDFITSIIIIGFPRDSKLIQWNSI